MKWHKKANASEVFAKMGGLVVGIAVLAIVLTVTFLIIAEGTSSIGDIEGVVCTGNSSTVAGGGGTSIACNATHTMQTAVATIPGWVPLIVIAVIGSILLGLVAMFKRR